MPAIELRRVAQADEEFRAVAVRPAIGQGQRAPAHAAGRPFALKAVAKLGVGVLDAHPGQLRENFLLARFHRGVAVDAESAVQRAQQNFIERPLAFDAEQRVELAIGVHHRLPVEPERVGVDFIGQRGDFPAARVQRGAARLHHESRNHPVKAHAVVIAPRAGDVRRLRRGVRRGYGDRGTKLDQRQEIRHIGGCLAGKQLDEDRSGSGIDAHQRIGWILHRRRG